jgi:ABC-2 type transport system permease protein
MPVTVTKLCEAYAVTLVLALYMLSLGNLSSIHLARGVDPSQSWRNTGSKWQFLMLLLYPVLGLPVLTAYLARYAFETEWAFYGVLLVAALVGAVLYWIAMESAVSAAARRREHLLAVLALGQGPVSA